MTFAKLVRPIVYVLLMMTIGFAGSSQLMAAVTPQQRKQVAEIDNGISAAARLYAANKYVESGERIKEVQRSLIELLENKDPMLQRLVQPLYARLEKAHALLELEGAELEELPTWETLIGQASKPADGDSVSFKADVAPWLIAQCGKCHIDNKRGKLSIATFNELMQGIEGRKIVSPGGSKGSRIVEVIESGDMPRGGGKVRPEDSANLQKWIDQGAKFDGPDPTAPLTSYAKANGLSPAAGSKDADPIQLPTGKETVKFAADVAPVLLENCSGCHINGRRPSGGLNMNNFAALMRGGESGRIVVPGQPDESLLIKKLKGLSGKRMPEGRPALSDEKIALISTWIKEGATYDGAGPNLAIEDVVNQSWAATASHGDLLKRRTERAKVLWNKVLPGSEPSVAADDDFVILGNVTPDRAQEWLAASHTALADARKQLRWPSGHVVKGGLVLFVYKGRYDYAEFGRMNENRQLPTGWQAHWRATPLDVYVAIVDDTSLDARRQVGLLVQQFTGALIGSLPQTPDWFAEGVARNVAVATAPRGDPRIEQWKRSMPAAAAMVDKSETLLQGRLDDEASGLVGMKLAGVMMDRRNRQRFDRLLELLRSGQPFPESLSQTFAPPDKFVKSWIGK